MGFLLIMGLIIGIICLINNNSKLSDEIGELKRQLGQKSNFCPNCGYSLNRRNVVNVVKNNVYNNVVYNNGSVVSNNYNTNNIYKSNSEIPDNKEVKNSLILIIGSILIILSAIIFLTSTWSVTHNFFKTIVIVLMLGVFMAASYIAEYVLKLRQTSKAFYYIALAYIPILLLSIALFELFGKYLSLYGLGKYIYLTISAFLVSGIYYYSAKKKNNYIIAIFSMIFQLLGLVFFMLIFTYNLNLILSILFIYNLILIFIYKNNKYFYNISFHSKFIDIFSIALSIISGFILVEGLLIKFILSDIFLEMLLFINFYCWLVKLKKKEDIFKYVYPVMGIFICYSIASLTNGDLIIRQLAVILSFVIIYFYEYFKNNEVNISSYLEILIASLLLYATTFIVVDVIELFSWNDVLGLNSYIVLIIIFILNIFNYLVTNKYRLFQAFVLTILFILMMFHVSMRFIFGYVLIIVSFIALILIITSIFVKKLQHEFKFVFALLGNVILWLFTFISIFGGNTLILMIIYGIYTGIAYYISINNKKEYFKIISYIYLNIIFGLLFNILSIRFIYIVPLTTLLIMVFEYIVSKIRSKASDIYLIIQFIISFICLLDFSIVNFVIFLLLGIIYMFYIKYYKKSVNYLYVLWLMAIPYIFGSEILMFSNFNCMYIISILLMIFMLIGIYLKTKNIYFVMFYGYYFLHVCCLEEHKYFGILLLVCGTYISYLIKENKVKDIFRFIFYISLFILYNFVIIDLKLDNLAVMTFGSYLVLLIASTRTIFKKYGDSYKIWEYIISSFINFIVLFNYNSEMDGIIYVMFLTILVILGYIYKMGPIFVVSLITILLNVFILTRVFWFSIPWWLYILLIGSVLVGFAIYNEIREKNNSSTIKQKMNDIKNNLNM